MRKCVIVMLVCAALYGCSGSADAPATEMYCYDDTAFLCERYPEADSIYHVTVAIDIEVPKGKQWQWLRDSIASDRQYDSESEDNWMADTAALGRYVHGFIDKYYSDIELFGDHNDFFGCTYEYTDTGRFMPSYGQYVCYKRNVNLYFGGAHGLESEIYYCCDLDNCRLMRRTDFISDKYDDILGIMLLGSALRDSTIHLFAEDVPIEPSDNFYIGEEGITFVYPEYEIAPYACGIVRITLCWDEIKALTESDI